MISLNYLQKKLYLNFHFFNKTFRKVSLWQKFSFFLLLLFFFLYPGHNYYQTLILKPTPYPLKPLNLNLPPLFLPISLDQTPPPALTASAVYVFDPDSGTILYAKNPDLKLFPASTTKIMTALVALDTYALSDVLTVKTGSSAIGHNAGLLQNDKLTLESLLYTLLIPSGNDAALTLAENYPHGGYPGFIAAMNQKAKALHLNDTHYSNASGIESSDHVTSVRDLGLLTKEAIRSPLLLKIVSTQQIVISDVSGEHSYPLTSTNQLLGKVKGLMGFKTGWTEKAGECLVSFVDRDGKKIITVLLGSSDRFGESKSIIDWAYSHYSWTAL